MKNILPKNSPNKNKRPLMNMYWMYALIGLSLLALYYFQDGSQTKDVDWTDFEAAAVNGEISKITVFAENGIAEGFLTDAAAKKHGFSNDEQFQGDKKIKTIIPSSDKIQDKIDAWNSHLIQEKKPAIKVTYEKGSDLMKIFWYFGPILVFVLFMVFMSRKMSGAAGNGGGIFSVGKSKAKLFDKSDGTNVTFKDVAGLAEAKVEVEEIVDFLKNPQRYTELGAKIPKGALLVGPPGTGKTLLAKAVAGEANVPFLSMSGSDFVEMFVGVGAARVRDLFKQAKEKAPCIVFIDEIDAVGRARGKNPNMGSNDERENTLNQMLTEMDGFGSNNGVIILAATNRADMLDKALMRPGRFDRQINVDLPELTDRIEIFNVHLRKIKTSANLDVEQLARQTQGFSGADIANVCNEAALIAARNNKQEVTWDDFMAAVDRIIGGMEKRSRIITPEEKETIATHEAGHASVSWLIKYGDPLVKVTIVPRGMALGAAWYAPESRVVAPAQALLDSMCSLVAGRAAEEVFLGEVGTGASNDLERATKLARAMVAVYGMSSKLPNLNYMDSTGQEYGFTKPYSEETASLIDEEVKRIVNEQYERAKKILREYAKQHNEMRDLLLEKEVIYRADVERILGPRKWKSRTDEVIELSKHEGNEQNLLPSSDNNDDDAGTPPPLDEKE
ncbi:MAG: ATP-dependent zinc metalloprotease FtsH [Prevotella sp.]|nr:ATP-dependent zinc metalloprotease FtsH [Bacteroides sp.]MCM1366742.1 ATP-dependent zinc metalloprotease FtsH [Prevotella sp.]MCM1437020.1 ATP-dependent zinc metalloprotease FtsH [Prevotella sp.]